MTLRMVVMQNHELQKHNHVTVCYNELNIAVETLYTTWVNKPVCIILYSSAQLMLVKDKDSTFVTCCQPKRTEDCCMGR